VPALARRTGAEYSRMSWTTPGDPWTVARIDRRYRSDRLREEAWALDDSPEHQEEGDD
jgi:hypothetical protein